MAFVITYRDPRRLGVASAKVVSSELQLREALELLQREGCEVTRITPKLRVVKIGGKPAAVLEIHADLERTRTDPDTGRTTATSSWSRATYLVCGPDHSDAIRCAVTEAGGTGDSCEASLAADGTLRTTCQEQTTLSLD